MTGEFEKEGDYLEFHHTKERPRESSSLLSRFIFFPHLSPISTVDLHRNKGGGDWVLGPRYLPCVWDFSLLLQDVGVRFPKSRLCPWGLGELGVHSREGRGSVYVFFGRTILKDKTHSVRGKGWCGGWRVGIGWGEGGSRSLGTQLAKGWTKRLGEGIPSESESVAWSVELGGRNVRGAGDGVEDLLGVHLEGKETLPVLGGTGGRGEKDEVYL